jgi:hypothetical protein
MFSIDENGRSAAISGTRHGETRADRIVIFFWKTRGAIPDSFLGKSVQGADRFATLRPEETLRMVDVGRTRVPSGPDLVDEPRRAVRKERPKIEGRDWRRPRVVQGASAPRLHTQPESASELARKGAPARDRTPRSRRG